MAFCQNARSLQKHYCVSLNKHCVLLQQQVCNMQRCRYTFSSISCLMISFFFYKLHSDDLVSKGINFFSTLQSDLLLVFFFWILSLKFLWNTVTPGVHFVDWPAEEIHKSVCAFKTHCCRSQKMVEPLQNLQKSPQNIKKTFYFKSILQFHLQTCTDWMQHKPYFPKHKHDFHSFQPFSSLNCYLLLVIKSQMWAVIQRFDCWSR